VGARKARQQARQAVVDRAAAEGAEKRVPPVTPAVPRTILKRPETVAAEKDVGEKKEAAKAAAVEKWKKGEMDKREEAAYLQASRPIRELDYMTEEEEASLGRVAHLAGMRAVEDVWEREWGRCAARATQLTQRQHQVQGQQQQDRPRQQQQQPQQVGNWAQRAAAAAALPQTNGEYRRVGRNGKAACEATGLEPIKKTIPWDERAIAFERAAGAPQINQAVATSAAALVNIALSKVAPAHVRTEAFKISSRGRLSTAARAGASAVMLLRFKKEIIEAARRADNAIINVIANETWAELKILVPYQRYREANGLAELKEEIEAENAGVIIPPFSMRWMRSKRVIEEHYQHGRLPLGKASVVFKVPGKAVGQALLKEMWVAGNKFKAEVFIPNRADTLCGICSQWGHSEHRCRKGAPVCGICSGAHRTEGHRCEVATCGKIGRVCPHAAMKCPNCGGNHPAQDARCKAKGAAIAIARAGRTWASGATTEMTAPTPRRRVAPEWTESAEDIEVETSGTAPPMAV